MTTDDAYAYLLRCAIPLVVAQPGPPAPVELRGVVRPHPDIARLVLAVPGEKAGLAVDFPLAKHEGMPTGAVIIDHARRIVAPQVARLMADNVDAARDSFGHIVIDAATTRFDPTITERPDHNVFSLFSMLVHGGGFPWFEETFTFAGFMLTTGNQYRVYVRITETGETYGTDVPLRHPDGSPVGVTALPQEIAGLIHGGDFTGMRATSEDDDYCASLVDMADWHGVPASGAGSR